MLKTLKDIEFDINTFSTIDKDEEERIKEDIKQEAIKHIEELKKEKNSTYDQIIALECTVRISWIKHFFNITEDDINAK